MARPALVIVVALVCAVAACDRTATPPADDPPPSASSPPPAPTTTPTGPARVEFESLEVNFGVVPETEIRSTSVRFTNTGGAELVIEAVKTTCGCTAAEPRKRNYAPGEVGHLDVEFDPSGAGEQTKSITVFTNAGEVKLAVNAFVEPFAELEPAIIRAGLLAYGKPHRMEMTLTCPDPDFTISAVTTTNPHVSARALPRESGKPAIIEVLVAPTAEWGSLFSWIRIQMTGRPEPGAEPIAHEARGRLQGQLAGRIKAEPDTFRFGVKVDEPFDRTVVLSSTDGQPFNVIHAEIYLDDLPGVSLEQRQLSPTQWSLLLKARGAAVAAPSRGRVVIETDISGEERLVINVVGVTRDRFGR